MKGEERVDEWVGWSIWGEDGVAICILEVEGLDLREVTSFDLFEALVRCVDGLNRELTYSALGL